jgi:hypothetical protein
MFDMERMAQTIQTIRDDGCGTAHQVPMILRGFDWNVGVRKLDAQAVSDLIACGWLTIPDRFGHARITAVPSLAM